MSEGEDMSTSPTRFASRIIIKPIPAVQHPTHFTTARAALVAIGMYLTLPYLLPTKLNKCANEEERREPRLADDFHSSGVIFTLIGTFAIACRILTIVQRRRKIGYDDHAMFMAYACSLAFTTAVFVSVRWGVGLDLPDVPVNWAVKAVQVCDHVVPLLAYLLPECWAED